MTMIDFSVSLDGVDITEKLISYSVSWAHDSAHNEFTASSADPDLYDDVNPTAQWSEIPGTGRLTIVINSETWYFLAEERSGWPNNFSFGGRSSSAWNEPEHATPITITAEPGTTVGEFLEDTGIFAFSITTSNMFMPSTVSYTVSGYPIEIASNHIGMLGRVIRASIYWDNFVIPEKYPAISSSLTWEESLVVNIAEEEILSYQESIEFGDDYTTVLVSAPSRDEAPIIEQEDSDIPPTMDYQEATIRVYWPYEGTKASWVSAGTLTSLGDSTVSHTETLSFSDGTASTQYPIDSVTDYSWIGASGGVISEGGGHVLRCVETDHTYVATVEYDSVCARYTLESVDTPSIIAEFSITDTRDLSTTVGSSGKAAPAIVDPVLENSRARSNIGNLALMDSKSRFVVSIDVPANRQYKDGMLAILSGSTVRTGNYLIWSATYSEPGKWSLELIRWDLP